MKTSAPKSAAGDAMARATIEYMNARRDAHRAHGTSGGKAARIITDKDRAVRDAGLACHDIALATVDAIWSEFRSWSAEGRNRPLGIIDDLSTEIPF